MDQCGSPAVLIITREVEGTATSIARARIELVCTRPAGHLGECGNAEHGVTWVVKPGRRHATILRHEDEAGQPTQEDRQTSQDE